MSARAEITLVIMGALLLVGLAVVVGYLLNERNHARALPVAPGGEGPAGAVDSDPTGLGFSREADEPSLSPAPCARGKAKRVQARVERIYGVDPKPGRGGNRPPEAGKHSAERNTVNLAERAAALRVGRGDEDTQRLSSATSDVSPGMGKRAS